MIWKPEPKIKPPICAACKECTEVHFCYECEHNENGSCKCPKWIKTIVIE